MTHEASLRHPHKTAVLQASSVLPGLALVVSYISAAAVLFYQFLVGSISHLATCSHSSSS